MRNTINESFNRMFNTILESDESKWRYFDTSFTSLKNALVDFLKSNNIYYELSGQKADYHFAIDCTTKQAKMINDFIDENTVNEVKESCNEATMTEGRKTKPLFNDLYEEVYERLCKEPTDKRIANDKKFPGYKGVFTSFQLGVDYTRNGFDGITVSTKAGSSIADLDVDDEKEANKVKEKAKKFNVANLDYAKKIADEYGLDFVQKSDTFGVIYIPEGAPAKHPYGLNNEFASA